MPIRARAVSTVSGPTLMNRTTDAPVGQATAPGSSFQSASQGAAPPTAPVQPVAPEAPSRMSDSPPPAYSRVPPSNPINLGVQALVSSHAQGTTSASDSNSNTLTVSMTSTFTSSQTPTIQGTPATSSNAPSNQVNQLPFFHERPIVPFPPGLRPLPPFPHTRFPLLPGRAPDGQPHNWYFGTAAVNPGLQRGTWDEWRPNIEAHRGLPHPWCPVFNKIERSISGEFPPTRVLPPPPRPPVRAEGSHFWAVYVGRVPGVYDTM